MLFFNQVFPLFCIPLMCWLPCCSNFFFVALARCAGYPVLFFVMFFRCIGYPVVLSHARPSHNPGQDTFSHESLS